MSDMKRVLILWFLDYWEKKMNLSFTCFNNYSGYTLCNTHHGDHGLLWLEMVLLQHCIEGVLQCLTRLHHDTHCLTSEGNLQPETHMDFNDRPSQSDSNWIKNSGTAVQQHCHAQHVRTQKPANQWNLRRKSKFDLIWQLKWFLPGEPDSC